MLKQGTEAELQQIMDFIVETDKLKKVLRQTLISDSSRQENSAEHSWHLALMAMTLKDYAQDPPVDITKVIQMLLVHDIVEIDAGDTFAYDDIGNQDKAAREMAAAERIYRILPGDVGESCLSLWREFEESATPEAQFANALDRLHPLLLNIRSKGAAWKKHGITRQQVLNRADAIKQGSPALWSYAVRIIDEAVEAGYLVKGD